MRIVEAWDQARYRRFAATGRAGNTHDLARRDTEAQVLQYRPAGIVAEPDVPEFDMAFDVSVNSGVHGFRSSLVGVENGLDSVEPYCCLCRSIGHLGQVLNRLEQLAEIGQKYHKRSGGHLPCHHQPRPK